MMSLTASPHLMAALAALGKSKEGLSDAELEEAINDTAEWTTLWVIRQLTSLGFIDYRVDFFGNPAVYQLTALGQTALATLTGKPLPQKPPAPAPASPVPMPPTPTPQPAAKPV